MQAQAIHPGIAHRQPVVRSGRATIRATVLRTGLWLGLIVIGSVVGTLVASLTADPASRALLVAGVGATALALVLLIVLRLFRRLAGAMRLAEEALGRTAADPVLPAARTGFAELDALLAKAGALRADRDAADRTEAASRAVLERREEELSDRIARLNAALDTLSLGFLLYDRDHRLLVVNRRYHEIYQLPPGAVTPGMPASEVLRRNVLSGNLSDRNESGQLAEIGALIRSDAVPAQIQHLADGRVVAVEIRPIDGGGFVAIYEEATERWNAEARIAHMARHDAVTDLPNRVLLRERIDGAIMQARRDTGFAVLCLDLDNFKQVNDTLGHAVGDELLRAVAHRLRACLREVDTVARLGGDEFAIIQTAVGEPADAATLAQRILDVVSAPYALTHHSVIVGVSIGIALAPGDGLEAERLMQCADVALYRAKGDGRGVFRFFEAEMDVRLQARRSLELDLRAAFEAEAFDLHYQPIYDLAQERICGFEALLRWTHPTRGRVSPAEFVPLAEEIGLIVPLGEWVLRRACREAVGWPEGLKVAVNVSAAQFTSSALIGTVKAALAESGLPARRLELEITESVLLVNGSATVAILHGLRNLGTRIAMDDFGTGYSSLSYLRSFPFDKMKVDQSFTRDLTVEQGSGFIARAVVSLASSLGMTTTAEGVETPEQLAWLREEGCDEVQGYLFSPPVPASALPALLDQWNGRERRAA
ncbi:diguanylate cyclase/phosphodiesterase [Methylorubrum populi]|uniref:Diguanylate cyclase/phosphodiesterase n=1 Tax=Methylorubrum populi TaxID=223967 RepID=A0A160PBC2_9HYPH|nr:EAL domain-containing protein [Methylorubrum populi]BAU89584.1 diguanylate cyclase/phosphodiesterase [Methylorubrum populi]